MNNKSYENFPFFIPIITIFFLVISYVLGALILLGFGIIISILYLVYCFGVETLVIFRSCKYCYYYNKICGFGKGKITSLFVKKGDSKKFIERKITFSNLIPDFFVFIFPIVGGIILIILVFSFLRLIAIVIFSIISFYGTAVIRRNLTCKYCKQREIGCPAQQFFSKKINNKNKKHEFY